MKSILALLVLCTAVARADIPNEQKICDSLYDKAIHTCSVIMCKDSLESQGIPQTKKNINDCLENSDGDLMEGAQICAIDGGEVEALVKAYNLKNPKKQINCEDN